VSRFLGVLRRTAARLDLPQPVKSHVLLEMAADLEDLFHAYRQRGLSEEEAEREVRERFDASDDALRELARLHRSTFRRWMDRFSTQAQSRWERIVLGLSLVFVAVVTGRPLVSTAFFREASGFVWVAIVIGIVAAGIFLAKAYRLYVKKDHRVRDLRKWLPSLLMLTCAGMCNGIFGFFLMFQLTMRRISEDYETAAFRFADWIVGSTATMILSLMVSILAALFWFVLMHKVRRVELAEAAPMLEAPR
jgi:hypothetical protein